MADKDPADCIHANTSVDYAVQGAAATLVVESCNDCGEKVNATIISNEN